MNSVPRHMLARVVARHGNAICSEPPRLEALLRDLCGEHRREINVIMGALEERVAAELIQANKSVPREALLARLARRLTDDLAYTPDAARWAVDAWAVALGVLTETEAAERERAAGRATVIENTAGRAPAPPAAPRTSPDPHRPAPEPQNIPRPTNAPPANAPRPARQQRPAAGRATPPAPRTPLASPVTSPPPLVASPPAVKPRPSAAPAARQAAQAAQATQGAPPAPRRGWKLRGCLITLLLLIVTIVGVVFVAPAIIALLREEQSQPSVNDPRF